MKKYIYLTAVFILHGMIQNNSAQAQSFISKSGSSDGPIKTKDKDFWWNIDGVDLVKDKSGEILKVKYRLKASRKTKVNGQKLSEHINANNNWFVPKKWKNGGTIVSEFANKPGLATLNCDDESEDVWCTFEVDENKKPIYK